MYQHQRITQHVRYGLKFFPFGILLPLVATSNMLGTLDAMPARLKLERVGF